MTHARTRIPVIVERRVWWLVPLLIWGAIVAYSLHFRIDEARRQAIDIATEGARDMFRIIVLARAWNAQHGGVYVPVTPQIQPNPYLEHPRRDLVTTDGERLTMINPAFMTRLLAELAYADGGTVFHITSLKPIRPHNAADDWERRALESFEQGRREVAEVVTAADGRSQLRYMAPLKVATPCLACHEKQGYRLGDIRGGISISQDYASIAHAAQSGLGQLIALHAGLFLLIALAGGGLLELLRRRWRALAHSIDTLQSTQEALVASNRSLAEARDAAEAAVRAKRAFLSNISHEMRTPMNAVTGSLFMLRNETAPERRTELVGRIDAATRQLLRMIDRMLDLSQLESRTLTLQSAPFSLAGLFADCGAQLQVAAQPKGLGVRLERDDVLPDPLLGDVARLQQLLEAYIENAVKFSERGEVALTLRCVEQTDTTARLRFEVHDQGIGLSAEAQAHLFQLFEQADMSSTRAHAGTGAGLALCQQLAELMGGNVGGMNIPTGGSCFWFEVTLPKVGPANTTPSLSAAAQHDAMAMGELMMQLEQLLAADDMAALAFWRDHADSLRSALGTAASAIEVDIGAFRFDAALAALRAASH